MKILKKGKIKNETHKFECEKCGCKFIADKVEYQKEYIYERGETIIKYETVCPTCAYKIIEFRTE